MTEQTKYPTKPDADGFFFENEEEEKKGISTKEYENGNVVKKTKLKKGRTAIVRELLGKDNKDIVKLMGDKTENYLNAAISIATKIDDKPVFMEDIDFMHMKDVNRLTEMYQSLNF